MMEIWRIFWPKRKADWVLPAPLPPEDQQSDPWDKTGHEQENSTLANYAYGYWDRVRDINSSLDNKAIAGFGLSASFLMFVLKDLDLMPGYLVSVSVGYIVSVLMFLSIVFPKKMGSDGTIGNVGEVVSKSIQAFKENKEEWEKSGWSANGWVNASIAGYLNHAATNQLTRNHWKADQLARAMAILFIALALTIAGLAHGYMSQPTSVVSATCPSSDVDLDP